MTQARFKIKRGDFVQVMVGKYKGKKGTVQKVLLEDSRVLVEGVNNVTRFIRPSERNPEGKINKTLPIHISNVALIDTVDNKPSRVGYKIEEGKGKIRFFKKSGALLEDNCK